MESERRGGGGIGTNKAGPVEFLHPKSELPAIPDSHPSSLPAPQILTTIPLSSSSSQIDLRLSKQQQPASLWQRRYYTLQVHPAHLILPWYCRLVRPPPLSFLGLCSSLLFSAIPSRQLNMFATTASIVPFLLMAVFVAQSDKAFPLEIFSVLQLWEKVLNDCALQLHWYR